jgi:hypothetical protein
MLKGSLILNRSGLDFAGTVLSGAGYCVNIALPSTRVRELCYEICHTKGGLACLLFGFLGTRNRTPSHRINLGVGDCG